MSPKQPKLTAGRVKERAARLEQKVQTRRQRLEQLLSRLERSSGDDVRLISAKERLERRLSQETEQLKKLHRILERLPEAPPEQSLELGVAPEVSEEFDDIHRSFEEVRASVHEIHTKVQSLDLPSNLPSRLNSFEERIARREEVDSDLFRKVLSLQSTLEQERQNVRKLSRRLRDNDQSLAALREAAEESVVAAVDLSEKLEELEEQISEQFERVAEFTEAQPKGASLGALQDSVPSSPDLVDLQRSLTRLEEAIAAVEARQLEFEGALDGRAGQLEPERKPGAACPARFSSRPHWRKIPASFATGNGE